MMVEKERIDRALDEAESKAFKALASYKFWMFGYHAAQWVLLNSLGAHRPNPFRSLVHEARRAVAASQERRSKPKW